MVRTALVTWLAVGCSGNPNDTGAARVTPAPSAQPTSHGPIADNISGPLGTPWPFATEAQLDTFDRGMEVLEHRFSYDEGLGPAFNVTFCGSCHEKPVFGGSGGLYRNFWLTGIVTDDGAFFPAQSDGEAGGDDPSSAMTPRAEQGIPKESLHFLKPTY